MLQHRLFHYALLLTITALLTLPNLGSHSLWDMDEGVNAEAAREMREAGTWITPLFNFELRTAKPVLLYWLQIASYSIFGVNEFAARFPSVLAAMVTVLLVYELGRSMFGVRTGLLAGIVLASAMEFCLLAHAATTDSTLLMFTVLTFYLFWIGSRNGSRAWFVPTGMAAGFAVLTKGPVGLVMPEAVIFFYLLWNRELKRLLDRRLIWGFVAFFAVAAPWYVIVSLETRGAWIKQFIGHENVARFMTPLENHEGPIFYHFVGITLLFVPWSIFLWPTVWYGIKEARRPPHPGPLPRSGGEGERREPPHPTLSPEAGEREKTRDASQFLICWITTYFVVFSLAATKLPNYVLAVYPALAILTARFLERWRSGALTIPGWLMPTSIVALGCVGVGTLIGFAYVGGAVELPVGKVQLFPGLSRWTWLGILPLAGAIGSWLCYRRQQNKAFLSIVAAVSVAYVGLMAAFPINTLGEYTAPKQLVEEADVRQPHRDVRLISLYWFQPSVVFYSRREVEQLKTWEQASDCLATRQPVYLFVPAEVWKRLQEEHPEGTAYRTVARKRDFLKNCDVLVVTNQ